MIFFPILVVFYHGVEDCQQFSHACRERELLWFTIGQERLIELFDAFIPARGDKCGHLECSTDVTPTGARSPLAFELATVSYERCQADKFCNLLPVQRTQFRQTGDEIGRRGGADSFDRLEYFSFLIHWLIGLNAFKYFAIEIFELLFVEFDRLLNQRTDLSIISLLQAVGFLIDQALDLFTPRG